MRLRLIYWMERTLKELEKVRAGPDPDAVHDLRVAIRRCRSFAALMEEVDPDPAWPEMHKLGRKLFQQLGELRDNQVLQEWVAKLGDEVDPVRQRLVEEFATREGELQEAALAAADEFKQKSWRKLEGNLQGRSRIVPPDGLAAECLALERLEAAKELHARAARTEKPATWHELRIGVKRFRYTVESLLPARYEVWGNDLKHVQDLLGDVHDLDVLSVAVTKAAATETEEIRARWAGRIATARHERIDTYRQLTSGETSLWQTWRQGLPLGRRLEACAMARLRVTAGALDVNAKRTSQISRLSMHLYDGFARVHAAPVFSIDDLRKIMRAAARLQGIGNNPDPDAPQKAARDLLRQMARPAGWTEIEWELVAQIERFQRGALPQSKHKSFARLTEADQKVVCTLAGILRLARALRKCGVESPVGLRFEKSIDAFTVHIPGLETSVEAAARLGAGKYLLESHLERPLILRPAPVSPPSAEETSPQSAVASD